mmetsp:Transcript_10958/g.27145  ORF Transcript_10958/g.27145 Transcript_10958/m.27145 type:complete len:231 (-) Transcript_10958:46-738(-)
MGCFEPLPWDEVWVGERALMHPESLATEALCEWGEEAPGQQTDTPTATVHNIVSTSLVYGHPMPINLQQLSSFLPNSSYNRRRFAAITIRMGSPRFTALLFTSGKLVVTGVKSWYECLLASLCMSRLINNTLVNANFHIMNCAVENIVAHSKIPLRENERLDIQALYDANSVECSYQRNMFPCAIYRGLNVPVVLLCFFSGRVVLTGGKTVHDIHRGWDMLWGMVRQFVR